MYILISDKRSNFRFAFSLQMQLRCKIYKGMYNICKDTTYKNKIDTKANLLLKMNKFTARGKLLTISKIYNTKCYIFFIVLPIQQHLCCIGIDSFQFLSSLHTFPPDILDWSRINHSRVVSITLYDEQLWHKATSGETANACSYRISIVWPR